MALRDVTKTFDSYFTRALTGVNLEIRRGEVFGLLGPDGSGKSTTLRILAGRLRPTEGKVRVLERSPWRSATKARVGYFPGKEAERGTSGLAGFVRRVFKKSPDGLNGRARRLAAEEQRRFALARSSLGNRDVILLDEPFSELDEAGRRTVREWIRTLRDHGKTVIFSSNSLTDARELCDRAAIYYEGRIQAVGNVHELFATREAIHFAAPLLPPDTADQVLKLIRDELAGPVSPATEPARAGKPSLRPVPPPAHPKPALTETATESVLAPLLQKTAHEDHSPIQEPSGDSVNHSKLAELSKPAVESPAPNPPS